MNKNTLPTEKPLDARDPDLVAAEIAMKRAAIKARQRAKQAGIGVIVWKEGRVVEEQPELGYTK